MPFVLLQAMMAAPFALGFILLLATAVAYTILRLSDRIRGKRNTANAAWMVKRRSVHLLLALLAGIIACALLVYIWSAAPDAGKFT